MSHRPPRNCSAFRQQGFTLIELLIVLAVAAALLTIGMPNLRDLLVRNQFASASNEFASLIASARSTAIKLNRSVTLCKAESNNSIICDDNAKDTAAVWQNWLITYKDPTDASKTIIAQQGTLPYTGNVVITSKNLEFTASGMVTSGNDVPPSVGNKEENQCRVFKIYKAGTIRATTCTSKCASCIPAEDSAANSEGGTTPSSGTGSNTGTNTP